MLELKKITVCDQRIRAYIGWDGDAALSQAAFDTLVAQLPHLTQQDCVDGRGNERHAASVHRFGEGELPSAPHAVEHVALELLYQDALQRGVPAEGKLVGFTKCTAAGEYEVVLSFFDDLRTMQALEDAVKLVNAAL